MGSAKQRIDFLRERLNYHNNKYYVENSPEISDFDFDLMLRELQDLELKHPEYADENSPTMRVGSDLANEFASAEHRFPMLSLSNTYSLEELHDFLERITKEIGQVEYVCELKFDGTAISLTYENGSLSRAVTRGDGTRGDDVTANVRTIRSVPLKLKGEGYPKLFEIRGEIIMPYSSFDRLNQQREAAGENLFANPRNAAAGTLKQQSSAVVAKRGLDCTLYQIAGNQLPFDSHWENLQRAKEWGFKISPLMRICHSEQEIREYINYWDEERKNLPFATDGIVIKVNRFGDQRALGFTAKAPKWAVAYKFKAEQALSELLSVDFQVGRTGAITPVANLTPVQLAGTTVRRATLHNAEQIAQMDLRLHDMVYVEKGGEIIPKIVGVELSERPLESHPFEYITHCPECGSELVRFEGEAKHYCPNESGCPPQIIGKIVHFIRRKAMDIDGLGEETVELLFENGLLRSYADLYDLLPEQLSVLPRLGEKSADNIIRSIDESRRVPLHRVLFALGIRFVGETTAKFLASHFGSLDAIMAASKEELCQAEEVGEKIATSIIDFFLSPSNRENVERLKKAGVQTVAEQKPSHSQLFAGLSFLISGSFTRHSRDELKSIIESNGGKNLSSVSSNVDYLIAGEKMGPAKLKKATELGLKIISEEEFEQMLSQHEPTVSKEEESESVEEPKAEPEETSRASQPIQGTLF